MYHMHCIGKCVQCWLGEGLMHIQACARPKIDKNISLDLCQPAERD